MAIDWTKIQKKYPGLWIALGNDEQTVVGFGETAKQAFQKAQETGCDEPILTRMPKELITYVGHGV